MKTIFSIFAAASIFLAACSSDTELETKKDVVLTDTTSMYKSNTSTDVSNAEEIKETPQPVQVRTVTRTVYVDRTPKAPARRRTVREASPVETEPVATLPTTTPQTQGSQTQNTGTTAGTNGTTTAPEAKAPEKEKGWNKSTKGAVIGGVGGAVTGAILSKNKVKGAIIGGVLGGVGGYILGRKKDKAGDAKENAPKFTSY